MALEAVVYQKGLFGHYDANKDLYNIQENWSWDFNLPKGDQDELKKSNGYLGYVVESQQESCQDNDNDPSELSPLIMVPSEGGGGTTPDSSSENAPSAATSSSTRPKRRRVRSRKNKEEIENQRMTHIAVERNRRKQMNEYLSALKSLMPDSYVQRSDQASIVGGAINYVKELEQNLHCLSAEKTKAASQSPFGELFSLPQYSTTTDPTVRGDVEVSMVECHANVKIRVKKSPKQLPKLVSGFHSLRLSVLHLNVTTSDQFALYSFSVRVEDDSKLTSVDEIATAVHQLVGRIQDETSFI